MTQTIEIKEGSAEAAIAEARFAAWLEIEKANRRNEIEDDIQDANRKREEWNELPVEKRECANERRTLKGFPAIKWPLKPLKVPDWNNAPLRLPHLDYPRWTGQGFYTPRRIEIAKIACTMTKTERDALGSEFKNKSSNLSSEDFQDAQHALGAWESGEEKRDRRARIEAARQKAIEIITKRKTADDSKGLSFAECFRSFGPEGGGFHGGSEWQPLIWDKLPETERKAHRKQWERVERLLPVYYEYARQSVKLLQLAVIHETIKTEMPEKKRIPKRESSKPRLGGCAMHPLEFAEREGIRMLHSRIGGYAEAVIKSLGEFLVQDMPYPLIPLNRRKWAASFVMSVNKDHHIMGPMLTDAGPVLDPWVIGQVERDKVRLARNEEATQKAEILYRAIINTERTKGPMSHEHVIKFDKALRATTSDQEAMNKRTKQKGHFRALDEDGGEVLALKISWKDTRDSELVEAFSKLIKWMRPRKPNKENRYRFLPEADWPERPARKKRGSKWETEAMAALNALIALRKKQSAKNAWRDAKEEGELLKRELKKGLWTAKEQATIEAGIQKATAREIAMGRKSKALTLPGAKLARITACFEKVIGGDESPWWGKCLRNRNDFENKTRSLHCYPKVIGVHK